MRRIALVFVTVAVLSTATGCAQLRGLACGAAQQLANAVCQETAETE